MKILLVEDSASVRKQLREALEDDYEVVEADNGLRGWLLASTEPRPDLIIADVEMPKLNGVSMAKRLATNPATQHIPVIFLTSRDRPADVLHGMSAGVRYYLTKPFEAGDVVKKVQALLQQQTGG